MLPKAFGMHLGLTWKVRARRRLGVMLGHVTMTNSTKVQGELHRLLMLLLMLFNPLYG